MIDAEFLPSLFEPLSNEFPSVSGMMLLVLTILLGFVVGSIVSRPLHDQEAHSRALWGAAGAWGTVQAAFLGLYAVSLTMLSGAGVLVSDIPWLPLETMCIHGFKPVTNTSASGTGSTCTGLPDKQPPKGFQHESQKAVGYTISQESEWTTILLEDSRHVMRIPSKAIRSRKLCKVEDTGLRIFKDRPLLWISPRYEPSSVESCPKSAIDLESWGAAEG
jgi:hypothetical protein